MRWRTAGWLAGGVAVTGAAALGYAALIERNLYTLRRFDVPGLALDAEPFRILHISDLHMTPGQQRKQDWVAALAGTDPDLVVVTGDNLAHPEAVPSVARAFEPLFARPGVFVFGSNDYAGPVWRNPLRYFARDRAYVQGEPLPFEDLRAMFTDSGWVDLNNARTVLKAGGRTVEAVGVDDPHVERDDYPSVAGPASPDADLHLGVTHSPEPAVLDAMAADGFPLLLAGHTHGGQVRVPGVGALVTNCGLDRRLARGLHRWPGSTGRAAGAVEGTVTGRAATPEPVGADTSDPAGSDTDVAGTAGDPTGSGAGSTTVRRGQQGDVWLHVSAGLGTHPTAPVRFACRPEASILTLVPR